MLRMISIDKKDYNKPFEDSVEKIRGKHVQIKLFLPPCDVPDYVTSNYQKNEDKFVISFQYSTLEEKLNIIKDKNISFWIGKESGKPLQIEVHDFQKDKISAVELKRIFVRLASEDTQNTTRSSVSLRQKVNLERAGEYVTEKADDLVLV